MWTGIGDPPDEYLTLVLCRDVFHCTPEALDRVDYRTAELMLELHMAEINPNNRPQRKHAYGR